MIAYHALLTTFKDHASKLRTPMVPNSRCCGRATRAQSSALAG